MAKYKYANMNKKNKSSKKYYKNSKKRPYDFSVRKVKKAKKSTSKKKLTKKKNNNSVIVMPLRRKRNKYSNLKLEYGIARKSATSSGNTSKGGNSNNAKIASDIHRLIGNADIKRKVNGEVDIVEIKRQMQKDLLWHLSQETAGTIGEEKIRILEAYAQMMKFITNNNNINNYIRDYQ